MEERMSISQPRIQKWPQGEITLLLSGKDLASLKTVLQLAYPELREMAGHCIRKERPGNTCQPTALVNEICLGFITRHAVFKNRRYFFGAAARAMRRALIDGARKRTTLKRGRHWQRVDFSEAERIGFERPTDLLDFDAALKRLKNEEPLWAQATELRVFGGWSTAEIATILGISESTARRRWASASKWLRQVLQASEKAKA